MFRTTRETLRCESGEPPNFFTALLSGRWEGEGADSRSVFIDRPPHLFAVVLHYLRSGQLVPELSGLPPERNAHTLHDVFDELTYLGYPVPLCGVSMTWHQHREELVRAQQAVPSAVAERLFSSLVDPLFHPDPAQRRPVTRIFLTLDTAVQQQQLGNAVKVALGVALHKADVVCDDELYTAAASNSGRVLMRRHASVNSPCTSLRIGLCDCLGEALRSHAAVVEIAFAASAPIGEAVFTSVTRSDRGSPQPPPNRR